MTGLLVPSIAFVLSINTILTHILTEKVDKAIENADSLLIQYSSIDLDIYTGKIAIHNVVFQTDSILCDSIREFSRLELSKVGLDGVDYYSLFVDREIDLLGITIDGIRYKGILDTKAMKARAAADAINDATRKQFKRLLKEAQKHLNRVTLQRLTVMNATADIVALETGLRLNVGNLGMEYYDIGYSLIDSIPFHFNDSVMKLALANFSMVMPDSLMNLQVRQLYTDQRSKGLVLTGIRFATDRENEVLETRTNEYHQVDVDTVRLDSISLPDLSGKRSIVVQEVHVANGHYLGYVDGNKKKDKPKKKIDFAELGVKTEEAQFFAKLKQRQEETMTEQQMKILKLAQEWLDEVKIDCISLENISLDVAAYNTNLDINIDDIDVSFNNLGYSLINKIPYHFNDSLYSISVGPVTVTTPDGLIKISSNGLWHSNCGPICVGKTTVKHTIDKWQLAHALGDKSATWVNLRLDTFYTSKVSPFSTVIDRRLLLDSVFVGAGNLELFADNRNISMPKFNIPSKETLLEIKRLFEIDNITVALSNFRTEITGRYSNNGIITMNNAIVSLNDIYFNNLNMERLDALFPDGTMQMSIGSIRTEHHGAHNVVVKDVAFRTKDSESLSGDEDYHEVLVDSIIVGGVELEGALASKNLGASMLRVVHPQYKGFVWMKTKDDSEDDNRKTRNGNLRLKLAAEMPEVEKKRKEFEKIQQRNTLKFFQEWLDYAQMQEIRIERASFDTRAINNGFSLKAHDFYLSLSGIGFNISRYIPIDLGDSLVDLKYFISNFKLIGNSAISNLAFRDLHSTMPDSSMFLNVKRVYTDYNTSSVVINDVEFATDTVVPYDEMYHIVLVDTLRLDGIVLPDLNTKREATASALRVIRPQYFGWIDESSENTNKEHRTGDDEVADDPHNLAKQRKALNVLKGFFDGVALNRFSIENGTAEFSSLVSDLSVCAEGLDLSFNDIAYEISDKVYDIEQVPGLKFNDASYSIRLRHADVLIPDSTMRMDVNNFRHENCGPIALGRTSMWHTIDKWELAHRNGDIPTTWFSMVLDTFRTSFVHPMNIFKDFQKAGRVELDSVTAVVDTLNIFRDMRYKPKEPYSMPHKLMMSVDSSLASMFTLSMVNANVNRMNVYMAMTDTCTPYLAIDDIWGRVKDISLAKGGTINIIGGGRIGNCKAMVEANLGLRSEYPWDIKLNVSKMDLSALNSLTFPIAGLNMGGMVQELRAEYGGDSVKASGVMMMKYNGLTAVFSKESPSPYKFIGKNYRFLNSCARTLITHNNPAKGRKKVRAYKVSWKNDKWNPAALFMIGPVIKGAIETILPGIFIHNKVNISTFR